MRFDHSWEAVLRPGASKEYFQVAGTDAPGRPRFRARVRRYSPVNAWWLSELSRLIYLREADETGTANAGRCRSDILAGVHLREYCFFSNKGMQFSLVTSCDDVRVPFAVLVFRGTNAFETWLSNLNTLQTGWEAGGLVHAGFKNEFFKIWEMVEECLSEVPSQFRLFYTGHSLGGAMATLAASLRPPSAVYTFGSPRVGDAAFIQCLREVPIFRVVNNRDLVALLPPSRIPFDFCHAGLLCHYPDPAVAQTIPPETGDVLPRFVRGGRVAAARRRIMGPPEFLSDHAPINYSIRLRRVILRDSG